MRSVESCLKVNAILYRAPPDPSVFMLAWTTTRRPWVTAAAVSLALLAGSFEGTMRFIDCGPRGQASLALRATNIDAITEWHFGGHRIDGLPRCLWYPAAPMACARPRRLDRRVGVRRRTLTAIALEGLVLRCSHRTLLADLRFVWGSLLLDALRTRASIATVARARGGRDSGRARLPVRASRMVRARRARIGLKGARCTRRSGHRSSSLAPCCCPCWPRARC